MKQKVQKKLRQHFLRHIFIVLSFVVLAVIFFGVQLDALHPYYPQQNIQNQKLLPVDWKVAGSLNYSLFLKQHSYQQGFQDNTPDVFSTYAFGTRYVLDTIPVNAIEPTQIFLEKNGTVIWPKASVVSRLKYPTVFPCTFIKSSMCIYGLDTHFAHQTWWYTKPILRSLLPFFVPSIKPFVTNDTYLSLYVPPSEVRYVLSNPCFQNEIIAYTPFANNTVLVRCSDNNIFQGKIVFASQ